MIFLYDLVRFFAHTLVLSENFEIGNLSYFKVVDVFKKDNIIIPVLGLKTFSYNEGVQSSTKSGKQAVSHFCKTVRERAIILTYLI